MYMWREGKEGGLCICGEGKGGGCVYVGRVKEGVVYMRLYNFQLSLCVFFHMNY